MRSLVLALILSHGMAQGADTYRPNPSATVEVARYLHSNDCPGAIKALNNALKDKAPEVYLLAGSLYEEGVCVKLNHEQAAEYFMRADQAKHPRAMNRLIAMYARNDPASALWWANKAKTTMPGACASPHPSAERLDDFIAELNSWPKGRLAACTYSIGVYNRILGLVEFPATAGLKGVRGSAMFTFIPGEGRVVWEKVEGVAEPVSGVDPPQHSERWLFRKNIMEYLEKLGERTLKEYNRPDGIDPALRMQAELVFRFI